MRYLHIIVLWIISSTLSFADIELNLKQPKSYDLDLTTIDDLERKAIDLFMQASKVNVQIKLYQRVENSIKVTGVAQDDEALFTYLYLVENESFEIGDLEQEITDDKMQISFNYLMRPRSIKAEIAQINDQNNEDVDKILEIDVESEIIKEDKINDDRSIVKNNVNDQEISEGRIDETSAYLDLISDKIEIVKDNLLEENNLLPTKLAISTDDIVNPNETNSLIFNENNENRRKVVIKEIDRSESSNSEIFDNNALSENPVDKNNNPIKLGAKAENINFPLNISEMDRLDVSPLELNKEPNSDSDESLFLQQFAE